MYPTDSPIELQSNLLAYLLLHRRDICYLVLLLFPVHPNPRILEQNHQNALHITRCYYQNQSTVRWDVTGIAL